MNNSKTILAIVLLMAGTLLTTTAVTTMVPAAYAGGDNDDGNQQKAEDESQAALADCDENDVERAGFDCIAIAASEIEIESATLSVCKVEFDPRFEPDDFVFTVTGNDPSPAEFRGDNADGCVDVTIGPGEYTVSEVADIDIGFPILTQITGDCVQDSVIEAQSVTGEIQAGETQECRFFNCVSN
jgi:hypothetical protein